MVISPKKIFQLLCAIHTPTGGSYAYRYPNKFYTAEALKNPDLKIFTCSKTLFKSTQQALDKETDHYYFKQANGKLVIKLYWFDSIGRDGWYGGYDKHLWRLTLTVTRKQWTFDKTSIWHFRRRGLHM
mmetsp:Transcript_25833/g.28717  ORF Transcript_25833/g.28717 Transcript_25833/m.28717 type:complete len:128 (-) Transcript_25833:266-649(-)